MKGIKAGLKVGMVLGRLTLLEQIRPVKLAGHNRYRPTAWRVRCSCGVEKNVGAGNLVQSTAPTRSCGCLRNERSRAASVTHGKSKTPEYRVYKTMLNRCYRPSVEKFKNYGARGITVCARWRASFPAFLQDMGPRPPGMSLERIDNDGNYEPANVRWATSRDQNNNRRGNRRLTLDGEAKTIAQWSRTSKVPQRTIASRLKDGWSAREAVFGKGVR